MNKPKPQRVKMQQRGYKRTLPKEEDSYYTQGGGGCAPVIILMIATALTILIA